VLFSFAREAAGASRARHSLRPLLSEGSFGDQLGRYSRRGNVESWSSRRTEYFIACQGCSDGPEKTLEKKKSQRSAILSIKGKA